MGNECRTGLVCAPKLVAGGYSQEHYCQKFVNYEEVCTGRNSVRCKSPLVCRPRDEDYGMGTGFDSICQLPEIPARYLEVCKKVDPNFKPKECETGLVCAPNLSPLQNMGQMELWRFQWRATKIITA